MPIIWERFDEKVIKDTHGDIYFYRDLYSGEHANIFPRAKELIDKGEIIDNIIQGVRKAENVRTPYIVANVSKIIPEIPAMLISRSLGDVTSSLSADQEQNEEAALVTSELIDNPRNNPANDEIVHLQQELIKQISLNSNLNFEHWGNIVQHQVDGGIVGVPWLDEKGLWVDFKARDVYYPHNDGLGADLAYNRSINDKEYLHVYRERIEAGDLKATHTLYSIDEARKTEQIDDDDALELLGVEQLEKIYEGRSRLFITYWANEKTFMNPLGISCLKNQEGKQDEINWTLTRNAITFERNGKPRIAVSTEIMRELQAKAHERYGDDSKIDHRDLEITTFDEKGKALEVIQIDTTKIGDIDWVKDLMKIMFIETKTSEKAVDFYTGSSGGRAAESGVSKFYDLFVSLIKAEQLQGEYIRFIQELIENALWLANKDDPAVVIEQPDIAIKTMIPISRKELVEENTIAFEKGAQSLETTVRRNNPNASEEWIEEELARIEGEIQGDDTTSLVAGRQTLLNFMDNRRANNLGGPGLETNQVAVGAAGRTAADET